MILPFLILCKKGATANCSAPPLVYLCFICVRFCGNRLFWLPEEPFLQVPDQKVLSLSGKKDFALAYPPVQNRFLLPVQLQSHLKLVQTH